MDGRQFYDCSMNAQADNLDFVTRYFLRRLAIARRKEHRNPRTPFVEAKVEVILIVIMFPIVGVASFVIMFGLHWFTPAEVARMPIPDKYMTVLVLWILSCLVGSFWLNRKFKRYLHDPTPCLDFDTEHDRKIVFWQRLIAYFTAGVLMPVLGGLIGFWPQLREYLF